MKNQTLTLFAVLTILRSVMAQGQTPPSLNIGSGPSLTKGTINTEVLTQIIQQKQDEIKQKVFRNTIVKEFRDPDYSKSLQNFTTYHYLYTLMDALLSGKNKSVITKSIMESSTEFAYIYGLALYYIEARPLIGSITIEGKSFVFNENVIEDAKVKYTDNKIIPGNVNELNLLVDLCYDIILNSPDLQKNFQFKDDNANNEFKTWYDEDNYYVKIYSDVTQSTQELTDEIAKLNPDKDTTEIKMLKVNLSELQSEKAFLDDLKTHVKGSLTEMNSLLSNKTSPLLTIIYNSLDDLKTIRNASDNFKNDIETFKRNILIYDGAELKSNLNKLLTDYDSIVNLDAVKKAAVINAINSISDSYDTYKYIYQFCNGLKKSNFKDFTLTEDQYAAMKYIIVKFLGVAKNQYNSDVVAIIIDLMLENTILEYTDQAGNTQPAQNANKAAGDKGYLSIDVESLILSIEKKFSEKFENKGLLVYVTPFFSIGVNYASFNGNNLLSKNADGSPSHLSSLYYASEKIGVKWKLWNWKYTHSIPAGERFKYFNQANLLDPWHWHSDTWDKTAKKKKSGRQGNPYRDWLRPQPQPTFSDMHFIVYTSGLLYNVANLKSNGSFNYGIVGAGFGVTFFNGLSANVSLASPFTDKTYLLKNRFINFGFDVPIIEYISALTKKNS